MKDKMNNVGNFVNPEEETTMNKMNNASNFVNSEEENKMNNNNNNNANNSINGLWEENEMDQQSSLEESVCFDNEEEFGIDNEMNIMTDEEWGQWTKEIRKEDLERIKKEREFERKMEESYKMIKEINKRKKEYKDTIKSFEETVRLAQEIGVEDDKILKTKEDIDSYFMPVESNTKDNYEEENEMNNKMNKNVESNSVNGLWEEITVENKHVETKDVIEEMMVEETDEAETKGGGFDASSLIDKGNVLIASPSSLFAYKEAIVLLSDVEKAIDTTDSYATKLSLESIKDGLMNLIAKYEAGIDTSGTTSNNKQLIDRSIFADKVSVFKEVTAEKVSVLKEVTSEKASQAKAAIDSIDEDNEYYQKGVEVTEKAKEKYNKVLGSVFNRLKL